jgi:hypothetical protein
MLAVEARRLPVVIAASLAAMLHLGCQRDPPTQSPRSHSPGERPAVGQENVIKVKVKVKVTVNGEITADGQPVTLEKLAVRFADLKRAGGVVWYYRENPAREPHANAKKVIELVVDNKLPIRLSTKPDFSDGRQWSVPP